MKKKGPKFVVLALALIAVPFAVHAGSQLLTFHTTPSSKDERKVSTTLSRQKFTLDFLSVRTDYQGSDRKMNLTVKKKVGLFYTDEKCNVDMYTPYTGARVNGDLGNTGKGSFKYIFSTNIGEYEGQVVVEDYS